MTTSHSKNITLMGIIYVISVVSLLAVALQARTARAEQVTVFLSPTAPPQGGGKPCYCNETTICVYSPLTGVRVTVDPDLECVLKPTNGTVQIGSVTVAGGDFTLELDDDAELLGVSDWLYVSHTATVRGGTLAGRLGFSMTSTASAVRFESTNISNACMSFSNNDLMQKFDVTFANTRIAGVDRKSTCSALATLSLVTSDAAPTITIQDSILDFGDTHSYYSLFGATAMFELNIFLKNVSGVFQGEFFANAMRGMLAIDIDNASHLQVLSETIINTKDPSSLKISGNSSLRALSESSNSSSSWSRSSLDSVTTPILFSSYGNLTMLDNTELKGISIFRTNVLFLGTNISVFSSNFSFEGNNQSITVGRDANARFVFDVDSSYEAGQVYTASFKDTTFWMETNSALILEASSASSTIPTETNLPFSFGGDILVYSRDSPNHCQLIVKRGIAFEKNSTFSSSCDLTFAGDIEGTEDTSIRSVDASTSLTLYGGFKYDAQIDLKNFGLLTLVTHNANATDYPLITGTKEGTAIMKGIPKLVSLVWSLGNPGFKKQGLFLTSIAADIPQSALDDLQLSNPSEEQWYHATSTPVLGEIGTTLISLEKYNCAPGKHEFGSFCCDKSGTCIAESSVIQSFIDLPANTRAIINGNLTTDSIKITGINTTLSINDGCVLGSPPSISIRISKKDMDTIKSKDKKKMTIPLLKIDPSCPTSSAVLRAVKVSGEEESKGCEKLETTSSTSGSTTSAELKYNRKKCDLWWIVLVSVLCGLLLLAIIVVVLVILLVPSVRNKIRGK